MKSFSITSYDTFSTVDGPGIRTVVFLAGCLNRCLYCHNPECFVDSEKKDLSFARLLKIYGANRAYYGSLGGLTFSGGEPLLQASTILDFLDFADSDLNVAFETSGSIDTTSSRALLKKASFVYLDFKFRTESEYLRYVGTSIEPVISTLNFLDTEKIPHIVRQVIVPGLNDKADDIRSYLGFLRQISTSRVVEFLPYHTMGEEKYERFKLPYRLKGTPALDRAALDRLLTLVRPDFPDFEII